MFENLRKNTDLFVDRVLRVRMRHLDDTVHRVDSERITSLVNAFNLLKEKIYEPAEQLSGADELEELVVDVLLRDAELFSHCRGAHLKIEYKYWNTVKQSNVSYHLQRISLVKFNFISFFSKKKRKLAKYRLVRSQILLVGLATHRSRVEVVVRRQVAVEFQLKFGNFPNFIKCINLRLLVLPSFSHKLQLFQASQNLLLNAF